VSMFKRERRQWAPEPWVPPFPGVTMGGVTPSAASALQSSAVWACVRLVASTVSMMPLHAFTIGKDGVRSPIPDPPFLLNPAASASMTDWVYMLVSSLMLRGNAYGRVVRRDAELYPMQIELLSPDDMRVTIDPDSNALVYTNKGVEVPREDVFHVRAFRLPGLAVGLSPIQYAAVAINRDAAIQAFSLGYFQDAPHPPSVLTSDQSVNEEQARTILERFLSKKDKREPLILGAGLKYVPLSVSPEESQFLQTQKLGVAEIARIFGVPPEMIAAEAGNSMTYANVEQRGIDFLTYSIQWWLTILESAVSPLLPGRKHVRFDPSVLMRTDYHTRTTATSMAIASHQLLPDEARAMNDLPPFTAEQKKEADLVPMTVSPSGRPLALPGSAPAGISAVEPSTTPAKPALTITPRSATK
jgi:HK97 family phage portal protein